MDRLPYVMLILVFALAYAPKLLVIWAMLRQQGSYDNAHPRAAYTQLTGSGARALAAHQNGLEGFAPFAAGVLACTMTGVNIDAINLLSGAFVVIRLAYIALYVGNVPTLRSTVWALGMLIVVILLALPIVR